MNRAVVFSLAAVLLFTWLVMNWTAVDAVWHNMVAFDLKMPSQPWEGGKELLHILYAEDSASQYLDLYLPDGEQKRPLLVLVHGGGFLFGDSQTRQVQWIYRYFRQHSYACASINYRLAQEATWPAALEDTKAAIRFLRANADRYGIDARRVAIWGESAGGYIAAMTALTDDELFSGVSYIGQNEQRISANVQVLVDFYGLTDFGKKTADFREEKIPSWIVCLANSGLTIPEMKSAGYKRYGDFFLRKDYAAISEEDAAMYCPRSYIDRIDKSSLKAILVHGEVDITVPVLQTKRMEDALSEHLGAENVFAIYPHSCKHADDRLYTDEILGIVEENLSKYLN